MVNRRASDAGPSSQAPIAPVVKRKRKASCLGEQERRERKRAIDREAQRSLREKTKTHIAELERTIQILRDQDRNGATASLLGEIDQLRQENERLRDVIDNVKSVVGSDVVSRAPPAPASSHSPVASPSGQAASPTLHDNDTGFQSDVKVQLPSERHLESDIRQQTYESIAYSHDVPRTSTAVDLDGMHMHMDGMVSNEQLGLNLNLDTVHESLVNGSLMTVADSLDSPATAAFAPFFNEVFGSGWHCPSPTVLHIGNPDRPATPSTANATCPIWKRSNQLFGKVFSVRPGEVGLNSDDIEAGLLYLGIKQGWSAFNEWTQSPVLRILKEVDEFLFYHLEQLERLAAAYKSFKLLKYYLNASKEELAKVPEWLRPSHAQARTKHPIALDFFAWPTLRGRLLENHAEIFQTQDLSRCYSHYLKFDWPFSFEDTFFFDEMVQSYYPSPLFERYHRDLKYWTVTETFYKRFPEMMADIEGDRRRFQELEVH